MSETIRPFPYRTSIVCCHTETVCIQNRLSYLVVKVRECPMNYLTNSNPLRKATVDMLYFIINSVIFTVNLGILPKSTSILHGKAVAFSHLWVIILCETEKEKKQTSRCSFFLRNHVIGMEFSILCLLLMSSLCITKDLGFFFRVIWHEPGGVVRGFAKRLGPHSQLTREDWPQRNPRN